MKNYYYFLYLILAFISCSNNIDEKHFKGEIIYFDDIDEVISMDAKQINLADIDAGIPAVHDSLLFFWYWKFPRDFFSVFNLKNSEHVGYFSPKGEGPEEVLGVAPISQFYIVGSELKTMLYAPNNSKLFFWNISTQR